MPKESRDLTGAVTRDAFELQQTAYIIQNVMHTGVKVPLRFLKMTGCMDKHIRSHMPASSSIFALWSSVHVGRYVRQLIVAPFPWLDHSFTIHSGPIQTED
jgi:hypothetical protein